MRPYLVLASFDGYVHVLDPQTGCDHRVDVGEHSYSQLLADDLTGSGRIELLLATMNGNVYCFETSTPFTPMRAWRSHANGGNVFRQREGWQGVEIVGRGGRHAPRAVAGASFELAFRIHDARALPAARYQLVVRVGQMAPLFVQNYTSGGLKIERVRCPPERLHGVLKVTLQNEHGQRFEDEIAVAFNEGFARSLKWAALVPYAIVAIAIAITPLVSGNALPL